MAMPARTPPLSPPLSPPTAAAVAREGLSPAEATPLHRSAVALRVEAAGPASTAAGLVADERVELLLVAGVADGVAFGAVELLKTAWLPARVTPAVEPLVRAVAELRFADEDGVRVADGACCACDVERCGRTAVFDWVTAPLVVAEAVRAGVGAAAAAGVCAGDAAAGALAGAGAAAVAAAGAEVGVAGVGDADGAVAGAAVEAGGAVGVAGVP